MKKMMFALAMIGCMAATNAYAQSSKAAWRFEEIVALDSRDLPADTWPIRLWSKTRVGSAS